MLIRFTQHLLRRFRDDVGQSVVEFAFVLPLITALILCLVDFGLGVNDQLDATQLASQAARLAAVNSTALSGGVQAFVQSQADTTTMKGATVSVCFPSGTANVGDPVRVTVTGQFNVIQFIPSVNVPVKGSSTMRLEQVPTNFTAGAC
jgi:Flp pilus assembly protein TadG